ncbi:MAG: ABC transporter substrate-binding protein, partial [Ruminococcaceae bacterium]|nr:ABC transporter substrate-binding protein [Oscillospiraceae bacterium]
MLKRITVVLLILLLLMTASACKPIAEPDQGDERLQIVTSFYVLYDFASRIGGDHVVGTNLVPPGAE